MAVNCLIYTVRSPAHPAVCACVCVWVLIEHTQTWRLFLRPQPPHFLSLFYPSILPGSSCLFKSSAGGTVTEHISLWNKKSQFLWVYSQAQSPCSDSSTAKQQQKSESTAMAARIPFIEMLAHRRPMSHFAIYRPCRKGAKASLRKREYLTSSLSAFFFFSPSDGILACVGYFLTHLLFIHHLLDFFSSCHPSPLPDF